MENKCKQDLSMYVLKEPFCIKWTCQEASKNNLLFEVGDGAD